MNKLAVFLCRAAALLLLTTLGVEGTAFAQSQAAPVPPGTSSAPMVVLPAGHPAYQAVDTLQKASASGVADNSLGGSRAVFNGPLPLLRSSGLSLNGEFAEAPSAASRSFGDLDSYQFDSEWEATLRAAFGSFSVRGGYADALTTGEWGRFGSGASPGNAKGPIVSATLALTPNLALLANGGVSALQSPLSPTAERLNHYDVGLKYGLTSQYSVDLGYEWDQWLLDNNAGLSGNTTGHPTEQYITIGVGRSFSKNTSLKLLYQIMDYTDEGTGFDPYSDGPGANGKEHDGVAVTQFSIKF